MTKFSKASLARQKNTDIRRLLLGAGCAAFIVFLMSIFSSSPSDSVSENSSLKGGGIVSDESQQIKSATSKAEQEEQQSQHQQKQQPKDSQREQVVAKDDRDFGKVAAELFDEDPENFALRDHQVFPTEYHFDTQKELYHHYRKGKSGRVVEDMLMCHAYAFHRNVLYGGSCGDPRDEMKIQGALLASLGLQETLPFACPRDHSYLNDGVRRSTVSLTQCKQYDTRIWTPEYVNYLRSLVSFPPRRDDTFTIVVHLNRRRKITPCNVKHLGFYQYLPNLHFMNVIEKYSKPGAKVIIFSEEDSYEPLNDFIDKGYEVSFESELSLIWHAFVTADVLILSRSDFSMIPSLVAQGKVVYTPSWHPPMRGWDVVDKGIMEITDDETLRLRETCPDS